MDAHDQLPLGHEPVALGFGIAQVAEAIMENRLGTKIGWGYLTSKCIIKRRPVLTTPFLS